MRIYGRVSFVYDCPVCNGPAVRPQPEQQSPKANGISRQFAADFDKFLADVKAAEAKLRWPREPV